jgi:proliferating cell nuclear antigen
MLIQLDTPGILLKAIEMVSELVTEVKIRVNEFGMSISAMDPANVAMVNFKIPKSAFTRFEATKDTLGINLESFKKILKRCGAGGSLVMEKKENMLEFYIQDRVKRNFTLSLIEVEAEDIDFESKISRMEFSSRVELSSLDFIDAIEDCVVVADACAFEIKEGKFIIEARGLNSARSEFSSDEANITAENGKAKYSLEYLQKFTKGAKLAEKTILNFSEDHPLKIDFRAPNMEINFVLAPRVETDD